MQTYYFHMCNDGRITDREGEPCDSLETAKRVAVETAQELAYRREPATVAKLFISVTDDEGNEVFRTPLVCL
jgi:hypothetical protein